MRAFLLTLAALGVLVCCFAVAIAVGWVRVPGADGWHRSVVATTQPGAADDDDDDAPDDPATSGAARPTTDPAAQLPALPDQLIILPAIDATIDGPKVRYFLAPNNSSRTRPAFVQAPPPPPPDFNPRMRHFRGAPATPRPYLAYWADPTDTATWTFKTERAGRYAVSFNASLIGSSVTDERPFVVTAGDKSLEGKVSSARLSRNFALIPIGTLELPAGEVHLTIHPAEKIPASLLRIREVRLVPVDQ